LNSNPLSKSQPDPYLIKGKAINNIKKIEPVKDRSKSKFTNHVISKLNES
jgi:hypothetical protein